MSALKTRTCFFGFKLKVFGSFVNIMAYWEILSVSCLFFSCFRTFDFWKNWLIFGDFSIGWDEPPMSGQQTVAPIWSYRAAIQASALFPSFPTLLPQVHTLSLDWLSHRRAWAILWVNRKSKSCSLHITTRDLNVVGFQFLNFFFPQRWIHWKWPSP